MINLNTIRVEFMRWMILLALKQAEPNDASENIVLQVVQSEYADCTKNELRTQFNYLEKRGLINVIKEPKGRWLCELTRYGFDVVDYTSPCEAGIARPEQYGN